MLRVRILLDLPAADQEDTFFSTEAFSNMISLKLLNINHVGLSGSYGKNFKQLRWFCWKKCVLWKFCHQIYHKLVVLDLQFSSLKKVCEELKVQLTPF